MNRVYAYLMNGAANLGWPGALGLGLLVFTTSFYLSTMRSQQAQLEGVRQEIFAAGRAAAKVESHQATPEEKLVAFYGFFPRTAELPDLLDKIFASARKQGLRLAQGEYRVHKSGEITQFRAALPVHGSYPQIRRFINDAMSEVPVLALEGIEFERQKVDQAQVDAKVKFAVYLGNR